MKICPKCGSENDEGKEVCAYCGAELSNAGGGTEQTEKGAPKNTDQAKVSKFERAVALGKKINGERNFIINGVMIVVALVVALVLLFAPVKISLSMFGYFTDADDVDGYYVITADRSDDAGDQATVYEEDYEYKNRTYTLRYPVMEALGYDGKYIAVNQSIFDIASAITYIKLDLTDKKDEEKRLKILASMDKALEKANEELKQWMADNPVDALLNTESLSKQKEKIYAKHLSNVNMLACMAALLCQKDYEYKLAQAEQSKIYKNVDSNDPAYRQYLINQHEYSSKLSAARGGLYVTLVVSLLYTALSVFFAIVAAVFLVSAVISMIAKKPQKRLFKFLEWMLSAAVLLLPAVLMPYFQSSAALVASTIITTLAFLLCGATKVFVSGSGTVREKILFTVKYGALTVIALVVFLLLTSSGIFKSVYENNGVVDKTVYSFSYPVNGLIQAMAFKWQNGYGLLSGYGDKLNILYIFMIMLTFIAAFAALSAIIASLRILSDQKIKTRSGKVAAQGLYAVNKSFIGEFIVIVLLLVCTFLSKPIATLGINNASVVEFVKEEGIIGYISAGAQIWVCAVIVLLSIIAVKAFKVRGVYIPTVTQQTEPSSDSASASV